MQINGILIVDKPSGPTSFDVVRRVKGQLRADKAGHTGTLDPLATGVLPICLGEATRLSGYISEGDKAYEGTVRLGETTDTQDAAGQVLERRPVEGVTRPLIEAALARFTGAIEQVPPMFSAVKVSGKRLYELAREGKEVARAPRPVVIHAFELIEPGVPDFRIRVRCSKGTYVRTLAHDLGQALGCGAHLRALTRIQSGPFTLADAVPLERIMELAQQDRRGDLIAMLFPLERAFADLPAVHVDGATLSRKVAHGVPIAVPEGLAIGAGARVRVLGPDGAMCALAEREGDRLRYVRVLHAG